tara:strand:- start:1403 stop:1618 length:216 start_codon:yes stop_codon:yes gene_type:complete
MDPLKFRKRQLFRQQSIDAFVGMYGDGMMPDLLTPQPKKFQRIVAVAFVVACLAWLGTFLAGLEDISFRGF